LHFFLSVLKVFKEKSEIFSTDDGNKLTEAENITDPPIRIGGLLGMDIDILGFPKK